MSILPKQFYYKNNRLQQLRGFYYTVLFESVSKAAKHMLINQSAVSMQIQSLERDLNIKLLDRKGPSFTLTDAGNKFFEMTVPHIEGINSICEKFYAEFREAKLHQFDIAANHISILHLLPKYIAKYKEKYPDIHIGLRNLSFKESMQRLKEDNINLIVYPAIDLPPAFNFTPIREFETVLVIPRNHELSTVKNLTLYDVAKYELIRIDPKLITVPLFEETIKKFGLKSNITLENGDWEILKHLVRAGSGVAILSSICLDKDDKDLIGIPLTQYFPSVQYGIITKSGTYHPTPVQNFIDLLLEDKDSQLKKAS